MYLTLQEWNARQRRPRSLETVRRWVRECRIFPPLLPVHLTPPVKDGREYLFHESAVKVDLNRPVTGSLLKRIRNGKKAKS
ncbi:excisionase [Escherichia coli]|uniref:excisionase n=1 Tax=Escherichia coli TaxID=562 RepID=UPI00094557CD|nr:excisionase [Escherichia coli]